MQLLSILATLGLAVQAADGGSRPEFSLSEPGPVTFGALAGGTGDGRSFGLTLSTPEPAEQESDLARRAHPPSRKLPFSFNLSAAARLAFPFGAAGDVETTWVGNTVIVYDHLRYSDLFDPGYGWDLQADLLFPAGSRMNPNDVMAGGYVSLQGSYFDGQRESDDLGNYIEPEEMAFHSLLAGFKMKGHVGGAAMGEVKIGAGVTRYEQVDATIGSSLGTQDVALIESSQRFTFESRFQGTAMLGPVGFFAGLGVRAIAGGENASTIAEFDPHTLWTFDVDVGIQIGF